MTHNLTDILSKNVTLQHGTKLDFAQLIKLRGTTFLMARANTGQIYYFKTRELNRFVFHS